MTASRALRNAREIAPATRERVLRAAASVGYNPDPQIARLMAMVRAAKGRGVRAVIGLVRDSARDDVLHDTIYQYHATGNFRGPAARYGYAIEEFVVGPDGFSPARLQGVLQARGIEGIIVSPQAAITTADHISFAGLAAATLGYGLRFPVLHRAAANMHQGMLGTMHELEARGYRRIGLAITDWIDARSDYTYSGALLRYQMEIAPARRVPLLLFPENNLAHSGPAFRRWVRRHRPDAIISFNTHVADWLKRDLGLRIPEQVGLVVHDWAEAMKDYAGIDHRRREVAAAAVDLVAAQLTRNEHGVPEVPRQILISPSFVDGPSIRGRE